MLFDDQFVYRYKCFEISSASESFKLILGPGSYIKDESSISDAMSYHDGQRFSTHDKDNDATSMDCAKQSQVQTSNKFRNLDIFNI